MWTYEKESPEEFVNMQISKPCPRSADSESQNMGPRNLFLMTDQPRQHIKKQRYYFANKCLSSQGYGFSQWSRMDVRVGL